MAHRQTSHPEPKGEKTGKSKSRIKRQSTSRGKYRPRKAPGATNTPGDRIRASRSSLGLTQKELGERLLTDQTTVSAWERGKSEKLAGPSLVALAMVLQTTPEAILTGIGWERPGPGSTVASSNRAAEPYAADLIHLPSAPTAGEAVWMPKEDPDRAQIMGKQVLQVELKKALSEGRPVWVVVG